MAIAPERISSFEPIEEKRISLRGAVLIILGASAVLWLGIFWMISVVPAGSRVSWAISYHHSGQPDEAGVKLVHSEEEAIAEGQRIESRGFVVTKIVEIDRPTLRVAPLN
jgi:hypothetical protein